MNIKHTIVLSVLIVVIVALFGCKKPTVLEKGKLTGVVSLHGETDHSGILVEVHTAGLVPEDIQQIRRDFPQIAFPIDDTEVFDHRVKAPLKTAYTDEKGFFTINDLPFGDYIVVYRKEGWGYNYCFGISMNSIETDLTSAYQLTLYPEVVLPGFIDGVFQLNSNRCYVVNSDVVLTSNAELHFQANSRLLLKPYVRIISEATFWGPESPSRATVTSYAGIHTGSISGSEMAEGVYIVSDFFNLQNLSFTFLRNALRITGNTNTLDRLSFQYCVFGLVANAVSEVTSQNSFFYKNTDVDAGAHYNYNVQTYNVENNLYYGNYIALKHEIVKNAIIENNAFVTNDRGFLNMYESTGEFKHNLITSYGIGIENTGKSNLEVLFNEIESRIGVSLYHTGNWMNTQQEGWTKANFNNIVGTEYSVYAAARYFHPTSPIPLDFSNNFWGVMNSSAIEILIYDIDDISQVIDGVVWAKIIYSPFRVNRVPLAGIQ